jgi:methyl-galactoside transport system substrate-binding protein
MKRMGTYNVLIISLYVFYDGKDDQSIQNQSIDTLLKSKSVDLLMLNLVNVKSAQEVINRIKEYNIPVILFNRKPLNDAWNTNKRTCIISL